MDMKTLQLETREGDRVLWVPEEAKGDPDHHLCQEGTIVAFEGQRVLIKFDEEVEGAGWDGAPAVAIDPHTLRIL
jgi:hypothetical protein